VGGTVAGVEAPADPGWVVVLAPAEQPVATAQHSAAHTDPNLGFRRTGASLGTGRRRRTVNAV
jgi:hypothetical protein